MYEFQEWWVTRQDPRSWRGIIANPSYSYHNYNIFICILRHLPWKQTLSTVHLRQKVYVFLCHWYYCILCFRFPCHFLCPCSYRHLCLMACRCRVLSVYMFMLWCFSWSLSHSSLSCTPLPVTFVSLDLVVLVVDLSRASRQMFVCLLLAVALGRVTAYAGEDEDVSVFQCICLSYIYIIYIGWNIQRRTSLVRSIYSPI